MRLEVIDTKEIDPRHDVFIFILFWKKIFKRLRRITEDVVLLGHELP